MTISFAMQVTVPSDVLIRELDGESVILDLNSERYFGLDSVGTRMWVALSTSASIQTAYDALLTEYEVEADQLKHDLCTLVEQLAEQGLIKISSEQ